MLVNLSGGLATTRGRARLSETAGSPANHRPGRPNAFALATVLGPTECSYVRDPAVSERHARPAPCARLLPKSCAPSASDSVLCWRAWAAAGRPETIQRDPRQHPWSSILSICRSAPTFGTSDGPSTAPTVIGPRVSPKQLSSRAAKCSRHFC